MTDADRQTDTETYTLRHVNTHTLGRDRMGYEKVVFSFVATNPLRNRKRYERGKKLREHPATHNVHRGSRHGWTREISEQAGLGRAYMCDESRGDLCAQQVGCFREGSFLALASLKAYDFGLYSTCRVTCGQR